MLAFLRVELRQSSQALPIFIDRLLTPVAAILLSVTAVLIVGEIIPQVPADCMIRRRVSFTTADNTALTRMLV